MARIPVMQSLAAAIIEGAAGGPADAAVDELLMALSIAGLCLLKAHPAFEGADPDHVATRFAETVALMHEIDAVPDAAASHRVAADRDLADMLLQRHVRRRDEVIELLRRRVELCQESQEEGGGAEGEGYWKARQAEAAVALSSAQAAFGLVPRSDAAASAPVAS